MYKYFFYDLIYEYIFLGLYKLQRHKMKHDPELKYKCPACPKQFVKVIEVEV